MKRSRPALLAVAFVTQSIVLGCTLGAFTLFIEPLEQTFDAPRWQVSLGPTLFVLALTTSGLATGGIMDRGALRTLMMLGASLLSVSLLLASRATELWQLAPLAFTGGLAIPMLGPLAGSALASRLYSEERGRALGFVNLGTPVGFFLFPALAGGLLGAGWEWREVYRVFAAIAAAVLPLVALMIPARLPNPGPAPSADDAGGKAEAAAGAQGGFGPLLRTPGFLFGAVAFGLAGGIGAGWSTQLAPFLRSQGLGIESTAIVVAASGGIAMLGTLGFGALADRFRASRLFAVVAGMMAAAFAVYLLAPPIPVVVLAALLFGVGSGAFIPLFSMILGHLLGVEGMGRGLALANLFLLPVTAAAGPLAAAAFDATGGYGPALLAFLGALVLAAGLSVRVPERTHLNRS